MHSLAGDLAVVFEPSVVRPVFETFNTLQLPAWFLMIFLPNTGVTKTMVRSNVVLLVSALMFVYLFAAATAQSVAAGNDVAADVAFLFTNAMQGWHSL